MALSETKGLRAQVRMGNNALFGVGCIATVAVVMAVAFDRAWSRSSLATSQGDFPAGVILALGWGVL